MTDLIDRQAAIDALRYAQHRFTVADEAGGMGIVKWSEDVIYFAAAEKVLDEIPAIEAEPVIHCKDCKWYGRADKRRFYRGMDCLQKRICTIVPDRDYCSRAERRTDA